MSERYEVIETVLAADLAPLWAMHFTYAGGQYKEILNPAAQAVVDAITLAAPLYDESEDQVLLAAMMFVIARLQKREMPAAAAAVVSEFVEKLAAIPEPEDETK